MVDLTIAAIPFFWGSMGAEALYLKRTRDAGAAPSAGDYEWRDTATSLGMGVASLVVPAVTRPIFKRFDVVDGRYRRTVLGVAGAAAVAAVAADAIARSRELAAGEVRDSSTDAGRGADGRLYPHGDHLEPDDLNIDLSYGKSARTWGPDVVGAHPISNSPFGLADMSGNVSEWTVDPLHDDAPVIRGGAFMLDPISAQLLGRQLVPPNFNDGSLGMRVCAPLPRPTKK